MGRISTIRILARSGRSTRGIVAAGPLRFACALGRSGRRASKREGDGATPLGGFSIVAVYWRADRLMRPAVPFAMRPIAPDTGWCDEACDRNYNRRVRWPYRASAERLWREDRLYDIIVVLDHNQWPRVRGHGSAIFMHVARDGYAPTEGCIALRRGELLRLLGALKRDAKVVVTA